MEPCPPGTSPWHFESIAIIGSYAAVLVYSIFFTLNKAKRTSRPQSKWILGTGAVFLILALVVGTFGIFIHFSWIGACQ